MTRTLSSRGDALGNAAGTAGDAPAKSSEASAVARFDTEVLDNAAWHSLAGAHSRFAQGDELVRRYDPDVAPFVAVSTWSDSRVWDSLTRLVGHGAEIGLSGDVPELPEGWEEVRRGAGVQLVETEALRPAPDEEAVLLGAADVPEMLALVERNRPGPFLPRTHELGRYVGIRREGRLVAMAGERLQPAGWTEISAVSTDDDYRRQGLASRLVLDVAFHIQRRGDRAMMHAAAENVNAIGTYERLGFAVRAHTTFFGVRVP